MRIERNAIQPAGEIERLIGAHFRSLRREAGISQATMVGELNRVLNWLRNHEGGAHIMRMDDAVLAAHVLGIKPGELFPDFSQIDLDAAFATLRRKRPMRTR